MSSLISLLLRGLSVYRWSNFSRIENPTALDHSAFTLQIAYLLTDLLLEKGSDIHVDRMTIYRHSLFSIFFTCTYSDIGSEVKARIRDAYPDYYRALCEKVDDRVATWQLPERAKVSMSWLAWLHLDAGTPESSIFEYAKLASAYFEAKFNARVYPEQFWDPMDKIAVQLNDPRFRDFRDCFDVLRDGPLTRFVLTVRRLQSSYRWNRIRRVYPISVMSHFYIVSVFTFLLASMEELDHTEFEEGLLRALSHDVPEAITGDIITPTKKAAPGFDDVIAKIEVEMVQDRLLRYLDGHAFSSLYAQRFLNPWEWALGKIVKLADHLSAYTEARIEELTNPMDEQFRRSREAVAERIRSTGNHSAISLLSELDLNLRIFVPDMWQNSEILK